MKYVASKRKQKSSGKARLDYRDEIERYNSLETAQRGGEFDYTITCHGTIKKRGGNEAVEGKKPRAETDFSWLNGTMISRWYREARSKRLIALNVV